MGETGFEPAASWSQTRNHTKLDYPPSLIKEVLKELFLAQYIE